MITGVQLANQTSPNFRGNLFNQNNHKIKSFDIISHLHNVDEMSNRGNRLTNIYINNFISEKNPFGGYNNSVRLTIENPLFGSQRFVYDLCHETNSKVNEGTFDELYHFDLLTGLKSNNCKTLENRAMYLSLMDEIKLRAKSAIGESLNPLDILKEKIDNAVTNNGVKLSLDRIKEFQYVAKNLLEDLIKKAIVK